MRGRKTAVLAVAVVGLVSLGTDAGAERAFTPTNGIYVGDYTGGDYGSTRVRLKVELLRPGLHGVRLLKWSGKLQCPGDDTQTVDVRMTAAREGRTFSGFATYVSPPGKDSFTGRFTAEDALKARVRVTRGTGAERCDTGPITFVARLVP
jgi:hypothetical protein